MISYSPLVNTLKRKKIDILKLQEMLGKNGDFLKRTLNEKHYISMKTLDEICTVLSCTVQDVIKWEEGKQKPCRIDKHVDVDWETLCFRLKEHNSSLRKESLRLGHVDNWLSNMRARSRMQKAVLKDICEKYNLDYDAMLESD